MENTVNISIGGEWFSVPALKCDGATIAITGKWIKMAVVHNEDFVEAELPNPGLCIERLKEWRASGMNADIFTFTQKLPATKPRFSYPMEWDSVAAVRTGSFKEWWEKLPQESRKNVRRSQKRGVVAVVKQLDDDLVRGIMDLNNDSPVRQGKKFVHYGKTLDQVRADQTDFLSHSDYVCAYHENELIGFLKIAYRGNVAAIVQVLPKASHHDKRPANALIAKAIEACEARGVSFLTYGMFNYGNKHDSPLRQFKVRNGFEEILMPRFYVPLTGWGKLCISSGLHLGVHGVVPNWLTRIGVSVRTKWYDLRHSSKKPA